METAERPIYMISVAAQLVGMHPQTLRMYETKGLVRPHRTPGGTRLYSEADIERLQRQHQRDVQKVHKQYRRDLVHVRDARLPERR